LFCFKNLEAKRLLDKTTNPLNFDFAPIMIVFFISTTKLASLLLCYCCLSFRLLWIFWI